MRGTFNGSQSPDLFDHGAAELQRWHRDRLARAARQERAERWIAAKFVGRTFTDLEQFENAVCALCVEIRGIALDEASHTVIVQACGALFAGLVDPRVFAGKIRVVRGESITFLAAA